MTRDELLTAAVRAGCAAGYAMECQHPYCGCSTTPNIATTAVQLVLKEVAKIVDNEVIYQQRVEGHPNVTAAIAQAIRALMP